MKKTKVSQVALELENLKVGEKFSKTEFIILNWGRCDHFVKRSFDVAFCNAKKMLPEKTFKCNGKIITRIK